MAGLLEVAGNYLFLQVAILVFVAPFYLAYLRRMPVARLAHLARNEQLEQFFSSAEANALVFVWAAAEAVAWFVIPEFLLLLVIFVRVRRKVGLLLADLAGTAVGTIVGLIVATTTHFDVTRVPYITPAMTDQVQLWYHHLGVYGLLFQPFSGIPYKVFVAAAPAAGINVVAFFGLALLVRIGRYYLLYLIFLGLYPFLHRFVSRHYLPVAAFSCLVFTVLFLHVYHGYGPAHVADARGVAIIEHVSQTLRDRLRLR